VKARGRRTRDGRPLIWPRGLRLSVTGLAFFLFTGTFIYLTLRFPHFTGFRVFVIAWTLFNALFFVRWTERTHRFRLLVRLGRSNRLFPRKLRLTTEGRFLLLITFGMGFAAINTGNNLFYLVLGLLISLITFSGILSELTLRRVSWRRRFPDRVSAGADATGRVELTNHKRRFHSYSLQVEEIFDSEHAACSPGRVLSLAPAATEAGFPRLRFERRGRYRSAGFSLATSFPFSFFHKSRFHPEPTEILVTPRTDLPVPDPDRLLGWGEQLETTGRGRGSEFYGARGFQPTDDLRDVHWKRTAATGDLVVKEYQALVARRVVLAVAPELDAAGDDAQAERAIEVTASLAARLSSSDWAVGLAVPGTLVPPRPGLASLETILSILAVAPVADHGTVRPGDLPAVPQDLDVLWVKQPHQPPLETARAQVEASEVAS